MNSPDETSPAEPSSLGGQLRALRIGAGLTGRSLAKLTGWQATKISKIETGRQTPTDSDLRAWAEHCGADGQTLTGLRATAAAQEELRALSAAPARSGPLSNAGFAELLANATDVRALAVGLLPAVVQTPGYARLIARQDVRLRGGGDVDELVARRLAVQQLLYQPGRSWELLVCEPALHWQLDGQVMRGQLDRLHGLIGLPGVRFGIVPLDAAVPLLPRADLAVVDGETVLLDGYTGLSFTTGPDVAVYTAAVDLLWTVAVEGEAARRIIGTAAVNAGSNVASVDADDLAGHND